MVFPIYCAWIAVCLLPHVLGTTSDSESHTTIPTPAPPSPIRQNPHFRTVFLAFLLPPATPTPTSVPPPQANPNQHPSSTLPLVHLLLTGSAAQPQPPWTNLAVHRWNSPAHVPAWYSIYGAWLIERSDVLGSTDALRLGREMVHNESGARKWTFRVGTTDVENADIMSPADGRGLFLNVIRRRPVVSRQNTFAAITTEVQDALSLIPDPDSRSDQGERIRALLAECDRIQIAAGDFPNRAIPFLIRKGLGGPTPGSAIVGTYFDILSGTRTRLIPFGPSLLNFIHFLRTSAWYNGVDTFHQNELAQEDQAPAPVNAGPYHQFQAASNLAGPSSNNAESEMGDAPDEMSAQGGDGGEVGDIDPSEAATSDGGEGSCERKRSLWRRDCASPSNRNGSLPSL